MLICAFTQSFQRVIKALYLYFSKSFQLTNALQTIYMQVDLIHASGSGRARRDAAARAMQGWHSHRLLGNGEVGDPIIKV